MSADEALKRISQGRTFIHRQAG